MLLLGHTLLPMSMNFGKFGQNAFFCVQSQWFDSRLWGCSSAIFFLDFWDYCRILILFKLKVGFEIGEYSAHAFPPKLVLLGAFTQNLCWRPKNFETGAIPNKILAGLASWNMGTRSCWMCKEKKDSELKLWLVPGPSPADRRWPSDSIMIGTVV